MAKRLLISLICILLVIIIVEFVYIFSRPQSNLSNTPLRSYAGTVTVFKQAPEKYVFYLRYISSIDNSDPDRYINFNQNDIDISKVEYYDNKNNLLRKESGIHLNTFQPGDKFDMIMSVDDRKKVEQGEKLSNLKVEKILIKIYKQ